jgi:dihydrofolate synthase/folylpolyglutamate synthase
VDLGLDRCARVAGRMGLATLSMPVVTVAGTNGKGSCIAYLASILESAGHRVAAYTSPFLQRYNESLRIRGREVEDGELIVAFENVEQARDGVALTFFEYRTLAVLDIIRRSQASVALLEVGLGGRLDAVNLMDADVAVVTSVDLDHTDWLGARAGRRCAAIPRHRRVSWSMPAPWARICISPTAIFPGAVTAAAGPGRDPGPATGVSRHPAWTAHASMTTLPPP